MRIREYDTVEKHNHAKKIAEGITNKANRTGKSISLILKETLKKTN